MSDINNPNSENTENINNQETIIGSRADEVIDAVNESEVLEETQKFNINAETEPEITEVKKAAEYIDEEEDDFFPVQFTKEDVLGSNPKPKEEAKPPKKSLHSFSKEKAFDNISKIWNKIKKPFIIAVAILGAVFVALYIFCMLSLQTDVVAKNVYIENLNVGGLSYDDALASVKATYLFENQKVTLRCNSQTFEIDGLDIGLAASPEETTAKAFNYAKSGNKFLDALKSVGLLFHKHTVVPVANINEEKLDEKLWEFGIQVHGELIGHYAEVRDNNEATVWPGHTGFNNDVTKAREQILRAFAREDFKNISVTLETAPPSDITVEQFDLAVYKDPVDAYYKVTDGNVEVVPEVNGRYIDKEKVAPMLAQVKEGVEPVIIPWETAYAQITQEQLNAKLFNDTLASYSTYYGGSSANRSANVSRAAELLNGAILLPDEVFSFNARVGKRTKYNGFYSAPEYANGQTVVGIGGGTCQVSTTLYSAVLYAGLDIISRTNHMFTVSYAPLGQDATVADDGVDFQFRNNTQYPVKVKAYTGGGSIYVEIIGTAWEPERKVKVDHSVSYSSGGTYVYSKRYIYENDECIADEELPSSYYKAHQAVQSQEEQ